MTMQRYVAVVAVTIGGLIAAPALSQTKLVIDAYMGPQHPLVTGAMKPLSKSVAEATQGRVLIELSQAPLAKSATQWEAVEKGISDVAVQYTGWRRTKIRLPALVHLPFMIPSAADASTALWKTYANYFEGANEFEGMKVLGFLTHNGNQIITGDRPLEKVDDFKGLKIRASAGEATKVLELMGAIPVAAPGNKVFEVFSKGVVDGVLDGGHAPLAYNVIRYTKYATQIPGSFGAISFAIYMNKKKWDALSKEDQAAITSVAGEKISSHAGKEFDTFSAKATQAMKDGGVKILEPTSAFLADIKKRVQPLEEQWLKDAAEKGVDGKAALAFYRSQAFK